MEENNELITIKEAAKILKLSETTTTYHVRKGHLKKFNNDNTRPYLLFKKEVLQFKPEQPSRFKKGSSGHLKQIKQYDIDIKNGFKICTKCGMKKDITKFRFREDRKRFDPYCSDCEYEIMKTYRKNNSQKVKQWKNENYQRKKKDGRFRIDMVMGGAIRNALNGKKAGRTWESILEFTISDLIKHLENNFTKEMNWNNFGTFWHIHHVLPKRLFNYDSENHPEFKICWSLDNLAPKEAIENIKQQDKLDNGKSARDLSEIERVEYLKSKGFNL